MKIYTPIELEQELNSLPGWSEKYEAIEKTFLHKDFKQALGFIVQVGILAEQADHHPEIFNVYNKVVIRLNTHSAKAITNKDVDLAAKIDLIQ
jgi:4a-hydroxytetrahydrobiopterin dehydratase